MSRRRGLSRRIRWTPARLMSCLGTGRYQAPQPTLVRHLQGGSVCRIGLMLKQLFSGRAGLETADGVQIQWAITIAQLLFHSKFQFHTNSYIFGVPAMLAKIFPTFHPMYGPGDGAEATIGQYDCSVSVGNIVIMLPARASRILEINAESEDIKNIRKTLNLPKDPYYGLHLTIGHATGINLDICEYSRIYSLNRRI